ncbi:UPF0755 protein [Pseudomonas duriflava]|uniref:Endolytic murein transglycosylase n=1 Tax=Pseudomonas duriflava TaxID=459528 RepID=A0A562Q9J7_9PSED|nr:endolytic transglycosylase MltG [Pseudomonas duriflava]TWI53427.1 UPF0755 protein [Pseudomonas duriflava]
MRKLLLMFESGLLLLGLAIGGMGWLQHQALQQVLVVNEERLIDIPGGATPSGTLRQLEAEGLLSNAFWLRLYWRFNVSGQALHSGEYRVMPGQTAQELIALWQRGEVVQYNITFVEGWTFRQLRDALARQEKIEQTLTGLSDSEVMARLGKPGLHPEGRFFPDTYRYVKGTRDSDILKQASQRLEQVLAEEWAAKAADVPYKDPYQALIMASLVEKETGVPQERGQIAGVFVRRLALNMLLQTDPTVIYGMGESYKGKLTRSNLREATPYNTYVNPGLPPTPIAMVGREAIHAALHPEPGKSLYFVARGDGTHIFSDSIEAHNRAVREYQLNRRSDYRSSPAPIIKEAP